MKLTDAELKKIAKDYAHVESHWKDKPIESDFTEPTRRASDSITRLLKALDELPPIVRDYINTPPDTDDIPPGIPLWLNLDIIEANLARIQQQADAFAINIYPETKPHHPADAWLVRECDDILTQQAGKPPIKAALNKFVSEVRADCGLSDASVDSIGRQINKLPRFSSEK